MFTDWDVQTRLEDALEATSCFSANAIDRISDAVYLDVYDNVVNDKLLDPEEDDLECLDDSSFRDCYFNPVADYIDSHLVKDND